MLRFIFIFILTNAMAQNSDKKIIPQSVIEKFAQDSDLSGASISFCIMDTRTNDIIMEYDKERKLIPASSQKLITCASTLKHIGPDYRYITSFVWNGYFANDSVFIGNIIIKGTGDPSFGSPLFKSANTVSYIVDTLYRILELQCIKEIQGDIIVKSDFIKDLPENPEWLYYDIGNYYGAGVYGFNVLENSAYVTIEKPAQSAQAVIKDVYPTELRSSISSQLKVQFFPDESNELYAIGNSSCDQYNIYGCITDTSAFQTQIRTALSNPAEIYREMLINQLTNKGIRINLQNTSLNRRSSYTWFKNISPSMDKMIKYTLKTSNNLYCESFLHLMSSKINSTTDRSAALKSLNAMWNEDLDEKKKIKLVDGSGLSRKNQISAEAMCLVLNQISNDKSTRPILELISDATYEGSLANYLSGSKAPKGKFLLKSGSMEGVRSYAGYIQYNNRLYSMALFINHQELKAKILSSKISNLFLQIDKHLKNRKN